MDSIPWATDPRCGDRSPGDLAVFDRLFAAGSADVLAGTHRVDEPPVEGGRWPVTVVSLVDDAGAGRLDDWTSQLVPLVGPDHFLTGRAPGRPPHRPVPGALPRSRSGE